MRSEHLTHFELSSADIAQIEASNGWRRDRVEVLTLKEAGSKVLVKGQRPRRTALGYRFMNALAQYFGLPWLQAAPAYGGSKAQALEFAFLKALQQSGVLAPMPLYQGQDYIVMTYLEGKEFLGVLSEAYGSGQTVYLQTWAQGLKALQGLHTRGLHVSQAFARNMIATKEGIAFIDFEDNPLEVMSLEQAQARDYAMYLHSTALWIENYPDAKAIWTDLLASEPQVHALLQEGAQKLAWLRHLPAHPTRYGRDTWRLQNLGSFLKYLS